MKKLTNYEPLTIDQVTTIKGTIATEMMVETGCHHDMAYMTAKTYLIELEATAQKYKWPVWTVWDMRRKYERSDDLSKPLH